MVVRKGVGRRRWYQTLQMAACIEAVLFFDQISSRPSPWLKWGNHSPFMKDTGCDVFCLSAVGTRVLEVSSSERR